MILAKFVRFYRVLVWIVGISLILALLFIVFAGPLGFVKYTANATVGPNDADTGGNLVSAVSGSSGLGFLGGKSILSTLSGNGGSSDFDQFTQTLTSVRLARVLVDKENILPVVFSSKWDGQNKKWYSRDDIFHRTVDFVKSLLNMPVKAHPDVDDLAQFLQNNLNVNTSYTSAFVDVSLNFKDPGEATRILNLILLDADDLIRQDKRRDVSARMRYLETQLPKISDVGERDSTISVLSTQQQMMVMVEADKHYAAAFVDTPNTSLSPTSPSISLAVILAVFSSFVAWCVLIFWLPEEHPLLSRLNRFPQFNSSRRRSLSSALSVKAGTDSGSRL